MMQSVVFTMSLHRTLHTACCLIPLQAAVVGSVTTSLRDNAFRHARVAHMKVLVLAKNVSFFKMLSLCYASKE